MSKKEKYRFEVSKLIKIYVDIDDKQIIHDYLINNSHLPGRRANLELASAFADIIVNFNERNSKKLWDLCLFLISFTPEKAATNNPKEFLPFCGAWAIGTIGASNPGYYSESLLILKNLSSDPRWRMREAVAFGIQKLLIKQPYKVLAELKKWIEENNWLTLRAIVAGIAHPLVLINEKISEIALEIHKIIFSKIIFSSEMISEELKILIKGLSYTLSVVVCTIPIKGFQFLNEYINNENKHIRLIIRENFKKNRLLRNFPEEVNFIKQKLKS